MLRRDKHPVGVLGSACIDTIDPDGEGLAERLARLSGRANKIRDDRAASFNNPIAHPAHAARVLDTIFMAKPRSRERLARTASALNTTALINGANAVASVVLPAPGRPIIRIFCRMILTSLPALSS